MLCERGCDDSTTEDSSSCQKCEGDQFVVHDYSQVLIRSYRVRQYGVAHKPTLLSLSALPITETELRLIASAAIIGLRSRPVNG